ncbi:MAG: hypothetical protein R2861_03725 [Desulfobacterales bacterium]
MGYAAGISVGNEANVDRWIAWNIWGLPHTGDQPVHRDHPPGPEEFIDMARSIVPHKPIVAYYVGGSEGGKKATFSHTGAHCPVGADRLYDGVFRQEQSRRAGSLKDV